MRQWRALYETPHSGSSDDETCSERRSDSCLSAGSAGTQAVQASRAGRKSWCCMLGQMDQYLSWVDPPV